MISIITTLKRAIKHLFPNNTFERGWKEAENCIRKGYPVSVLRSQACGDIAPDSFTKGWKARCDANLINISATAQEGE
jgi:hypothetical protein